MDRRQAAVRQGNVDLRGPISVAQAHRDDSNKLGGVVDSNVFDEALPRGRGRLEGDHLAGTAFAGRGQKGVESDVGPDIVDDPADAAVAPDDRSDVFLI